MKKNLPQKIKVHYSEKQNPKKNTIMNMMHTSYIEQNIDALHTSNQVKHEIIDAIIILIHDTS